MPRRRVLLAGSIRFPSRQSTFDCVLRNISVGGARLQLTNTSGLPDAFELAIPHHDLCVDARVIWRELGEAGVAFPTGDARMAASGRPEDVIATLRSVHARDQSSIRVVSTLPE